MAKKKKKDEPEYIHLNVTVLIKMNGMDGFTIHGSNLRSIERVRVSELQNLLDQVDIEEEE